MYFYLLYFYFSTYYFYFFECRSIQMIFYVSSFINALIISCLLLNSLCFLIGTINSYQSIEKQRHSHLNSGLFPLGGSYIIASRLSSISNEVNAERFCCFSHLVAGSVKSVSGILCIRVGLRIFYFTWVARIPVIEFVCLVVNPGNWSCLLCGECV